MTQNLAISTRQEESSGNPRTETRLRNRGGAGGQETCEEIGRQGCRVRVPQAFDGMPHPCSFQGAGGWPRLNSEKRLWVAYPFGFGL
jgi:hypothetical protein